MASDHAAEVLPSIAETLAGAHIFITGATGYLGKAVVEKLLRGVPDLGRLYILARGKRDLTAQERVNKQFTTKLYERCRQEQPDAFSKVTVVTGDILEPGLGLSESDVELLVENATVVIHSAATVRFQDHVRTSLRSNLKGTQHCVEVARKLTNLKAFIHVSTAFVHSHLEETREKVYTPEIPPQELLDTLEWMDEMWSTSLTPRLLNGRPNTYILTKGLTEHWLVENARDLPLAIFRPSIIAAAMAEPYDGWCESLNGPVGVILALGKGLLRTTMMDPGVTVDVVPVDLCTNMLIAILWRTLLQRSTDLLVYHGCTSMVNGTSFGTLMPSLYKELRETPYDTMFARPSMRMHRFMPLYLTDRFFLHLIPAYVYDAAMQLCGNKPRLVRLYKDIHVMTENYAHFQTREYKWQMDNYYTLLSMMSPEDRTNFNFDMSSINWDQYWRNTVLGIKKFILKEDLSEENLVKARKQYLKMRLRRFTWNFCLALAASRFLARFRWVRSWLVNMVTMLQLSVQTVPILARLLLL